MPTPQELVYHGTDGASAASIQRRGLNNPARRKAAGGAGVDDKGFSVTTDLAAAEAWAKLRAAERGGTPVVLQAPRDQLPLRTPNLASLGDPNELYIDPADFAAVGAGVFEPSSIS
jgi:hypothetical protein